MNRLLILNRGEIACRIIRSAQQLNLTCIAVYEAAEKDAMHVQLADEACELKSGYLDIEAILKILREHRVDAVHPGYGFLSENAQFAEALEKAGITFIGPPASAIAQMGDKNAARELAEQARVPVMKGFHLASGKAFNEAELKKMAEQVGYPILLKATAGGGGKGMTIVHESGQLFSEYERLRAEALRLFRNDALIVERFLEKARHVEVQIIGNHNKKNFVLFDRDCSMQRNNQKILEEAPAPGIDDAVRQKMHEAAVRLADQVGYSNAGTIEFLFDAASQDFFFLEMNTRLQVEHTVTEMITGLDLVKEQIHIAAGRDTEYTNVSSHGWAIEARVCAESPDTSFTPDAGRLVYYREPAGVRIDSGVRINSEILPMYDNMIAKVIAWGEDRVTALNKLVSALQEYVILGVKTNIPQLIQLLETPEFKSASHFTRFAASYEIHGLLPEEDAARIAAINVYFQEYKNTVSRQKEKAAFTVTGEKLTVY